MFNKIDAMNLIFVIFDASKHPILAQNMTVEKSQINATNVTMHALIQVLWDHIQKHKNIL